MHDFAVVTCELPSDALQKCAALHQAFSRIAQLLENPEKHGSQMHAVNPSRLVSGIMHVAEVWAIP